MAPNIILVSKILYSFHIKKKNSKQTRLKEETTKKKQQKKMFFTQQKNWKERRKEKKKAQKLWIWFSLQLANIKLLMLKKMN